MFGHLHIYEPRERALVGFADLALAPLGWIRRWRSAAPLPVRRVLLLRLERIGDLLMALDAIADARLRWPDAAIDLAVGSWNLSLARMIPDLDDILTVDVPWLARERHGDSAVALVRRAIGWRARGYDLVVNLEPDIRSNALAWLSGARYRVGYWTGGGGAFLTDALAHDPTVHVATNGSRVIARAAGETTDVDARATATTSGHPRLAPPADAVDAARRLLSNAIRPLVGIHASGGRESKQWHLDRFAEVGHRLVTTGGTVVLTGSVDDRPMVDRVRAALGDVPVIDAAGALDLPALAALLGELDVLVSGDTGPMHLAAAMATPVVAIFGPSQPTRYGPRAALERIVRIDLPCSPCGQVRLPPQRCRGHVPDCLDGIGVNEVVAAASDILERSGRTGPSRGPA